MVLQWFHMVCYIPSDSSGEIISKLRTRVFDLTKKYLFSFDKFLMISYQVYIALDKNDC